MALDCRTLVLRLEDVCNGMQIKDKTGSPEQECEVCLGEFVQKIKENK